MTQAIQRKALLKSDGFIQHKKNPKGTTIIFSRNHPTAKFVRVVVDSGMGTRSGKIARDATVKLCYINRQKNWREITTPVTSSQWPLATTIASVEAAEKFVKTCKHCKAKKFTAKTGNVVCANACWTAWGNKKKNATTKKTTQKKSQKTTAQKIPAPTQKKKAQKVTPKSQRTYPLNKRVEKKSQKKHQKIVAEMLPGDLVSVEELEFDKVTHDFTGSILGIVMKTDQFGAVEVNWTANTSSLPSYDMPFSDHYKGGLRRHYRFKVLSRPVEWAVAA